MRRQEGEVGGNLQLRSLGGEERSGWVSEGFVNTERRTGETLTGMKEACSDSLTGFVRLGGYGGMGANPNPNP